MTNSDSDNAMTQVTMGRTDKTLVTCVAKLSKVFDWQRDYLLLFTDTEVGL